MNELKEIFQSNPDLSLIGFALRTVVTFVIIFLMAIFLLKRAAGQFGTFDFAFLWMLGALAVAPVLDGEILFSTTITALASLFFWHWFISLLTLKNHKFAVFVTGKPIPLVEKGKILEKNMRRSFFSTDLLLAEMRLADAPNLNEVDEVILETNGKLSIVKKFEHTPATPTNFDIEIPPGGLSTIVINYGHIIHHHLKSLNLSEQWLREQLMKHGIFDPKDVYLATVSPDGKF